MRLYLAGPMRGYPEFNFPAFDAAAAMLREAGHWVWSPAEYDREHGFDAAGMTGNEDLAEHGFDLREAIARDLGMVTTWADGVAVLTGWEASTGATAEVAAARAIGIHVNHVSHWRDNA